MRPDELERRDRALAGETVVAKRFRDKDLVKWATEQGLLKRIGRGTKWANPFVEVEDGTRDEVCDWFAHEYLPRKRGLLKRIEAGELCGKVLECWCHPKRCHGHHLARLANQGRAAQ